MLNLTQVRQQVKQINPQQIQLNSNTLAGQNEAYRQLKALGWTSAMETHPADRVPVLRLGAASIRRDKKGHGWIVEIDGEEARVEGLLSEITAQVKEILNQTEAPTSTPSLSTITFDRKRNVYRVQNGQLIGEFPAGSEGRRQAELAALKHDGPESFGQYLELVAQGEDEGRARRAARLVQRGHVDLEAGTVRSQGSDLVYHVNGICECEDYQHHGEGCKHQLALRIVQTLADEAAMMAQRKQADKIERRGYRSDTCENCGQNWRRCGCSSMKRETALPDSVTEPTPSVADVLGYDPEPKQPANIGEKIQQLLDQEPGESQALHEPSEAEKAAGLAWALGNQQPKASIGSMPVAWQMRGGE